MGNCVVSIFEERNVEVVVGAAGDARKVALAYLSGELKSTGSICHEHADSACEFVARMLKRFASDRLIELKKGVITLIDTNGLKELE